MADRGAPIGNTNGKKAKKFLDAMNRAIAKAANGEGYDAGLDKIAVQLVTKAIDGEQWAIQEIANRLDGKAAQAIIGGDEDDPEIKIGIIERVLVRAKNQD